MYLVALADLLNPDYSCVWYLQKHIQALLEKNFPNFTEFAMRDPLLFGDYRNTLDDGEARLYEDIQDFEAAKALFQEVWTGVCWGLSFLFR